jgi:hypothetical protein
VSFLLPAVLAACGGGYGGGGSAPPVAPTIDLAVQPTTITAGQNATITRHEQCDVLQREWRVGRNEPTSGNMVVTPTAAGSDTYTDAPI